MGIRPVTPVFSPMVFSSCSCCARTAVINWPVCESSGPAFGVSSIITPVRSRFWPIIWTCSTSMLFLKLSSAYANDACAAAISGVIRGFCSIRPRATGCSAAASGSTSAASAMMMICALRPGPKPSSVSSMALRCVDPSGDVESDGSASSSFAAGTDNATSSRIEPARNRPGVLWMSSTQRRPIVLPPNRGRRPFFVGLPAMPGTRPAKILSPNTAIRAGSSVSEMSTARPTVMAAEIPISERNGIFAITSAARATMTVRPANTTDEPAVPVAMPMASSRVSPLARSDLYRDRMNSA